MLFNRCCRPCCNPCCDPCCDPCRQDPIIEPTKTTCVEKQFCHEVPHICPIHTHTINKHIYNHTYTPQYTCSEECQTINNCCGSCADFR